MGGGPARDHRASQLRLRVGQLVEGLAHRGGGLVTVGGDPLADRVAVQADEPGVDAAAGGVDPDGVAAVAGHPEPVARIVFALVGHPGHGADPRFNAEPPSNAASKLWRPANGPPRRRRSPADGISRMTAVVARAATEVITST